ncbi:fumarylacetoacetate hydrolase family protein [Roseivivax isoporae]|uniref:fumarylacetoacetate hydrolase family protein n=1 Tax=Roseivivax isoporae TaxID=591206 RepID=UPI001FCC4DEE|nr:fumarylacetoacetate hydrolase family protein [Roseivivax isoporae]
MTLETEGKPAAGILEGDEIRICAEGEGARDAVIDAIVAGELAGWDTREGRRVPLSAVRLLAPIPLPRGAIYCVGKNYHAHADEFHSSGFDSSSKEAVPKHPVIFTKPPHSVVGPETPVRGSLDPTGTVDYEGELGVVIGKAAFQVDKASAYDHVLGYVIINDVTSRELQRQHGQWTIGKGLDTFCPMGPWLVSADEAGDPARMELRTEINGELRQKASVSDLVFDIPTLIETMSRTMTLHPGDIIATGTAAGVGIGFTPPRYLQRGDVMRVSITGLGALENTVE